MLFSSRAKTQQHLHAVTPGAHRTIHTLNHLCGRAHILSSCGAIPFTHRIQRICQLCQTQRKHHATRYRNALRLRCHIQASGSTLYKKRGICAFYGKTLQNSIVLAQLAL